MPETNKINVIIDGRNFTVVGADDENYVKNLAYYVDQKIKNLANKNSKLSQTMTATLAALNIADELSKTKSKLNELENKAKEPLEKFSGVSQELQDARLKIIELENLCKEHKDEVLKTKQGVGQYDNEIKKLKDELELKALEIEEINKSYKNLQERNFENQIELVEAKKELSEVLKIINEKRG